MHMTTLTEYIIRELETQPVRNARDQRLLDLARHCLRKEFPAIDWKWLDSEGLLVSEDYTWFAEEMRAADNGITGLLM